MGKFLEGLYDELSLFIRHCAWLNTAPQRPENDTTRAPRLSRLEKLTTAGHTPDYPPIEGAAYLVGYLFEVGPLLSAGMGVAPITHLELHAWMKLTGVELQPWEVRFLRRLSAEYLSESLAAEKADRPAPWSNDAAVNHVAKSLQASIQALTRI